MQSHHCAHARKEPARTGTVSSKVAAYQLAICNSRSTSKQARQVRSAEEDAGADRTMQSPPVAHPPAVPRTARQRQRHRHTTMLTPCWMQAAHCASLRARPARSLCAARDAALRGTARPNAPRGRCCRRPLLRLGKRPLTVDRQCAARHAGRWPCGMIGMHNGCLFETFPL